MCAASVRLVISAQLDGKLQLHAVRLVISAQLDGQVLLQLDWCSAQTGECCSS